MDNRFNHISTSRTRSIPCRSTQQLGQRSTAHHSRSNHFVQFLCAQQSAYGNALVSGQTSQRNHSGITMTADNHAFYFVGIAAQSLRQEIFETRAIQSTAHTDDAVLRNTQRFQRQISHGIHRVRDNHENSIRRIFQNVLCNRLNDACIHTNQLFTSHTRLTGNT